MLSAIIGKYKCINFPSRADPVFPASMWQGNLGVNRAYVDRIIDIAST